MMNINYLTVAFFGHRDFMDYRLCEEPLRALLLEFDKEYDYIDFLVGRNGEFDIFVSSVIRSMKEDFSSQATLILVLPDMTAEFRDNEESFYNFYDEIEFMPQMERPHFKAAITRRNECMVDNADIVIVYVERENGGAFHAMQYARKKNKSVFNLKEMIDYG